MQPKTPTLIAVTYIWFTPILLFLSYQTAKPGVSAADGVPGGFEVSASLLSRLSRFLGE